MTDKVPRVSKKHAKADKEQERLGKTGQGITRELVERVKELDCLYKISKLVETYGIPMKEILKGIADIMPSAWQYSEIAGARILVEGLQFQTENFEETPWRQSSYVFVHGRKAGIVEIVYLEERPEYDNGPFLTEEQGLIDAIAERTGRIVEHKQAEEALRLAHEQETALRKELEAEIQKRSNFLRLLLHELKTPLTAVMASSSTLVHILQEGIASDLAANLYRGSVRLNSRIDGLVDLARGELEMLNLHLEGVEMLQLVGDIAGDMAPVAERMGQSLIVDLPPTVPVVFADRARVRQVIVNLLD
ncbi:unnamed protein product, partial [marine sediment metagenome]